MEKSASRARPHPGNSLICESNTLERFSTPTKSQHGEAAGNVDEAGQSIL